VAAAFLMDMSASTGFPLPDAQPVATSLKAVGNEYAPYFYGGLDDIPAVAHEPKRRVIDVAKDALALMCEALQRLGDSCALYGFSGDGREHVEFHVAKDFGDRLSVRTWAALAAMEPVRSTRMGTAIRHALTKLLREPARVKVLIIVSDGYPQDHDYGPDRKDDTYGIEDTACALREAERAGVLAFCVTIDPAGHDYLRRMCAESRYMVIDDVMALPRELTKIYRTLTA
jgi:nitric oxide reductase NorD protein